MRYSRFRASYLSPMRSSLVLSMLSTVFVAGDSNVLPPAVPLAAAAASSVPCSAILKSHGVVHVAGVLSQSAAARLRQHVDDSLATALQDARHDIEIAVREQDRRQHGSSEYYEDVVSLTKRVLDKRFGDVLSSTNRHDLKLDPASSVVREASAQVLDALRPTLQAQLGADARLYELAALVVDPGALAQPLHPDTPFRNGESAVVLTAFVALQDIDATMGPTLFFPGTHTAEAHALFRSGTRSASKLKAVRPTWQGSIRSGDATLYDSRLLHGGGANTSPRRRVLFYLSFRAKGAEAGRGTLLDSLRRAKHTLQGFGGWLRSSRR